MISFGPPIIASALLATSKAISDVKFGIIMDVEASHAIRQAEVGATQTMIERTEERFKAERLAADTAYGCTPEGGIAPKLTC